MGIMLISAVSGGNAAAISCASAQLAQCIQNPLAVFAPLLPAAAPKKAEQGIPCIAVPAAQDIPRFSHAESVNPTARRICRNFPPSQKSSLTFTHENPPLPAPYAENALRFGRPLSAQKNLLPAYQAPPPRSRRNGNRRAAPLPRPCAGKKHPSSRASPFPHKKSRLPATLSPPRRSELPAPRVNLSDSSFVFLLRLLGLRKPLRQPRPELIAPDDGVGAHARAAPVAALRAHARKVQALGLDHVRSAIWTAASHFLNRFLLSFCVLSIPQRAADGKS